MSPGQQRGFALRKCFMPGCVRRGLDLDLRVRPPAPAASGNLGLFKTCFFQLEFETLALDIYAFFFQNRIILREFENWDLDIFPKSEISIFFGSISSEWAHIKINSLETGRVECHFISL